MGHLPLAPTAPGLIQGFPNSPSQSQPWWKCQNPPAALPVLSNLLYPARETEAGRRGNALGEAILLPKPIRAPGTPVTCERIFICALNWWFFTCIFIHPGARERLPWKTSPAGTPLPGETPPAPHPRRGPRFLLEKTTCGACSTLKRGISAPWCCRMWDRAGWKDTRAGLGGHSVFIGGVWWARAPRWHAGSCLAAGPWMCTERDGSCWPRVFCCPQGSASTLEHPIVFGASHLHPPRSIPLALEHPIIILSVPSSSTLEHPTHLGHPIHFGASQSPSASEEPLPHPCPPSFPATSSQPTARADKDPPPTLSTPQGCSSAGQGVSQPPSPHPTG